MMMITGPACRHCDDDDDEEEDEDGEGDRHVAAASVQPQLFGVPEKYKLVQVGAQRYQVVAQIDDLCHW